MKGANFYVEPMHQSLHYHMPYRIEWNPQELLEALLNQKLMIVHVRPRVK